MNSQARSWFSLPAPIESVTPLPGDATLRQAVIEVDMEVGYEVAIFVDGFRVPDTEVTVVLNVIRSELGTSGSAGAAAVR